jgi:hypothetical protein
MCIYTLFPHSVYWYTNSNQHKSEATSTSSAAIVVSNSHSLHWNNQGSLEIRMILWSRQEKYKTSLINTVLSQKVTNTQKMTNSYQNDIGISKSDVIWALEKIKIAID